MTELPRGIKEPLSPKLRIERLRRSVNAFGENAERCDIWHSNFVSEFIGEDIDFLSLGPIGPYADEYTDNIGREAVALNLEYLSHREKLNKCKCERKR